jgi:uncharacterized damage-inducible protein DinB
MKTTEFFIAKLRRYTTDVTVEEMRWTPAGINNPLSWIVRHCADLLWLIYGRLSEEWIPANLGRSGIAWGSVKGTTFDEHAPEPGPDAQARMAYLDRAWRTLKAYLQNHPEWQEVELVVRRRRQSARTLLQHNLGDLFYHTGQASYLRKLLGAERRRVRARRQRAGKAKP